MLRPEDILSQLPTSGLFRSRGVPWRLSPQPLALPRSLVKQLQGLGHILAKFQEASQDLYNRSTTGEVAPWIAQMLDAGKPEWLISAQRSKFLKRATPHIIRPDLLWCDSGFAMTELDSVPGGLGTTLFLSRAYAAAGFEILGGAEGIVESFRAAHPEGALIGVSQESSDYRPEMNYLASQLGSGYSCVEAEDLPADAGGTIYRFFELFDTSNVPPAQELIQRSAVGLTTLSPPAVEHLEEKVWLALLHTPSLRAYWRKVLRSNHLQRLLNLTPHTWITDPTPLPPQAALPWINLHCWDEVANLSQKDRRLVLKISGFSPLAWGSRGVYLGHDMRGDEWAAVLQHALEAFPQQLWIMQEFHEAKLIEHPYFTESGDVTTMKGRARICPYYFRTPDGHTTLGGCLACIAPADKKKIHGMSDAILVPCIAV